MKKLLSFSLLFVLAASIWQYQTLTRVYQAVTLWFHSKDHSAFYQLTNNRSIEDITEKLKHDTSIPIEQRKPLLEGTRRIYVFKYLSDGNQVAGYLSLLTKGTHPVLLFLRGGNGNFGIIRPTNSFSYIDGYNVMGTLYRGNMYGGHDDFGGDDINDVENLMKFIPALEVFTHSEFKPPYALAGGSRGAMQMFTALSRSDFVKGRVNKAISISGNVDLEITAKSRPEMRYLFEKKFKEQSKFDTFKNWLNYRNPAFLANQLNPALKVLMIYGLKDNRVPIEEQISFYNSLEFNKIDVKFIKIPGANHGMDEHMEQVGKIIKDFLSN